MLSKHPLGSASPSFSSIGQKLLRHPKHGTLGLPEVENDNPGRTGREREPLDLSRLLEGELDSPGADLEADAPGAVKVRFAHALVPPHQVPEFHSDASRTEAGPVGGTREVAAAKLRAGLRARPAALAMSAIAGMLITWAVGFGARTWPVPPFAPSALKVDVRRIPLSAVQEAPESEVAPPGQDDATNARSARELVNEGNALLEAGKLYRALTRFERALELVPDYPRALSGMASVAIAQRRGKDAVRYARALIRKRPRVAANRRLLGDAYESAGNIAAARKFWALAAEGGDEPARRHLRGPPQCQ